MTHSLRLADAVIDRQRALLVLPADLPFLRRELIEAVVRAPAADVVYPRAGPRPGHPVRFSSEARRRLGALPDGDTLRALRDDPALTRLEAGEADAVSQLDVDDEAGYARAVALLK